MEQAEDEGEEVCYVQDGERVTLTTMPQPYGEQLVVKIARIEIECCTDRDERAATTPREICAAASRMSVSYL